MKILITSLSLLHITSCIVYNVIPEDYNTTCNHCRTLQYYQLNVNRYFTSNTQLLFLPGIHYLHTHLMIEDAHNLSLIGSTANGSALDTVIQYVNLVSIVMTNITNLTLKNLIIQTGEASLNKSIRSLNSSIIIRHCKNVILDHLEIHKISHHEAYSLMAINMLGKSHLSHILCNNIRIYYHDTKFEETRSFLSIDHYQTQKLNYYLSDYQDSIELFLHQTSYEVSVELSNITIIRNKNPFIKLLKSNAATFKLIISNCQYQFNFEYFIITKIVLHNEWKRGIIYFYKCYFLHNTAYSLIVTDGITINITDCIFYNNSQVLGTDMPGYMKNTTIVFIANTFLSDAKSTSMLYDLIDFKHSFISLWNTSLTFTGKVTFTNINHRNSIISLVHFSTITINGLLKLSNNYVNQLIDFNYNIHQFMNIKESGTIEISHNQICTLFNTASFKSIPYRFCFFQYISSEKLNERIEHRNFSIVIHYNNYERACDNNIPITNCQWLPHSSFKDDLPLDVNKQYIQYYNNNDNSNLEALNIKQSTLCICSDEMNYDCHASDLGYSYSGQIITVFLHGTAKQYNTNTEVIVETDINLPYIKPCTVLNIYEHQQFMFKSCTELSYTIAFSSYEWCEIHLKIISDSDKKLNIFTVRKLKCPPGFAEINNICQCDPVITSFNVFSCNINDQTILRPAKIWISATTHGGSYNYQISLHCPFHYCLSRSSHLNFSTPNSQCQFNRSGLLCGQCQQGLSSVFGSSYCQKCSSIYIILIIPIAITGVVLVFIIFYLNLTVTDGNVNVFIFYANIISINIPVFFPNINGFVPAYTFISLANLDLGIQTCFYNGMDDYAKIWLQLVFPLYLILIAMALIITSRYSTTIQRFTARRALPVLATLFLLSYTKILHTVSNVLFFYSSITYLPSKHTILVWSIDANVPLFGVHFTILFIVCVIIFLILIMFNIILLFTRTLSRFRFINKYKPLLDAYQGPYKDKYYYWIGLQLLIRAVFFGLSSLDRNINLTVGIILLCIYAVITCAAQPFSNKIKNYQELILIVNLHGLFVISLYTQDVTNMTVVNIMISLSAVQFSFIFAYHIITYACGGVFNNMILLCVSKLKQCTTKLHIRLHHQHFQLQDFTRNNIPEVTFNYSQLREPLVGQD